MRDALYQAYREFIRLQAAGTALTIRQQAERRRVINELGLTNEDVERDLAAARRPLTQMFDANRLEFDGPRPTA